MTDQKVQKTKTIHVTQHDINCGFQRSNSSCPIALAVGRVFDDAPVIVRTATIAVGCSNEMRLPRSARTFVVRYDGGDVVAPFSFRLDLLKGAF